MAFNLQTFKTRALTAVIFVLVMLAGLLVNQWTFLALFSLIHFGCWVEYQKLVALIDPDYKDISPLHRYGMMLIGFGMMLWMAGPGFQIGTLPIPLIGWSLFWVEHRRFCCSQI